MKEKIAEVFKEKNSFLITAHNSPCGDAIGSELALRSLLERLDKEVTIINSNPVPPHLLFLPGADRIDPEIKGTPEVAVVLDCGNLARAGTIADRIKKFDIIINIDHHVSNENFGTLNYVNTDVSATGEQIFPFFELLAVDMTREEAICLYTSITADTGSFQHRNTSPRTHEIAAYLLRKGVDPSLVARELYGNFSLENRKLLGLVLSTLRLSSDGRIAWFKITQQMYKETKGQETDASDFIDYTHSMKGVMVSLSMRETDGENIKVSFRSEQVDVVRIAQVFGGGGHVRAAGCTVKGKMEEVEQKVLEIVQKSLPD